MAGCAWHAALPMEAARLLTATGFFVVGLLPFMSLPQATTPAAVSLLRVRAYSARRLHKLRQAKWPSPHERYAYVAWLLLQWVGIRVRLCNPPYVLDVEAKRLKA